MIRGSVLATVTFAAFAVAASFTFAAEEQPAPAAAAPEAPAAPPAPAPTGPMPPWAAPDVLKAQLEIRLTDPQKPQFKEIVGKFISDRTSMILAEIRKGNVPNLEQDIYSRSMRLEKEMDRQLKPVLTPEQWKPYEAYKKALKKELNKPPPNT